MDIQEILIFFGKIRYKAGKENRQRLSCATQRTPCSPITQEERSPLSRADAKPSLLGLEGGGVGSHPGGQNTGLGYGGNIKAGADAPYIDDG